MREIYLLRPLNHSHHFLRIVENVLHLRRQIFVVSHPKQNQFLRSEIVQDPLTPGSNNRFALRQKLKNSRRRVEFGEFAAPVWNDADVTLPNSLRNFL